MDLHPREAVLEALDVNHSGFAVVHHYLDVAVQETAVQWEHRSPNLRELHGAVLAGNVRGLVETLGRGRHLQSTSLRMVTVSNCGQHLYDERHTRYRILERPLSQVTPGRLLPVTEPEIDTLFGTMPAAAPYELAVLWSVDFKTKSLHRVVLAAIADLDNPKTTAIYAEEPLPAPNPVTLARTQTVSPMRPTAGEPTPADGFADVYGSEEDSLGEPS